MNIKYLKRFTGKMNRFSSQIEHDIRIDSTTKTKERRKSMMDEFKQDNINAISYEILFTFFTLDNWWGYLLVFLKILQSSIYLFKKIK